MSRYREFAAGVSLALALSSCSAVTAENEAINNPTTTIETNSATTNESAASITQTTQPEALLSPEEKANERVQELFEEYVGKLACATSAINSREDEDLGFSELGDVIVARTDTNTTPPEIQMSEWLIEEATNDEFARYITHEIFHACALGLLTPDPPITLPSGDVIISYEGFTIKFDSITISGPDVTSFGLPEEGAAELVTKVLKGDTSSETKSYKAIYNVTKKIVEESGLSLEEVAIMAAEGKLPTFFADYYGVTEATPSQILDVILEYQDAYFEQ